MGPCKTMTDILAPVERTNWALSAWNSTLAQNDVPSAWLYGQDHLWATGHLVSSPGSAPIGHYRPGILPLPRMMSLRPGCMVRTICGQLVTSCLHLGRFFLLPPHPSYHPPTPSLPTHPSPPLLPPTHPLVTLG